jgi:palmitoyltransferase ZDHHC1/11
MVPSSVDPDAAGHAERANKAKKPVKISAWKLAKLDSNEAIKAAAKARASSSIIRPLDAARQGPYADLSSSGNASMRSNLSIDYSATKHKRIDKRLHSRQDSYPQSLASQDDYESSTHSASSISSPVHIHKPAPHTQVNVPPRAPPPQPPKPVAVAQRPPVPTTQIAKPMFQSASYYNRENRKASVVWDQQAGRYVSVAPAPTRPGTSGVDIAARTPHFLANPGGEPSNRVGTQSPVDAPSSALPSGQPSERLMHTGQSIFFGGPLLGAAADHGSRAQTEGRREPSAHQHDTGTERRRTAEPFPVSAPGTIQKSPPFNRRSHSHGAYLVDKSPPPVG